MSQPRGQEQAEGEACGFNLMRSPGDLANWCVHYFPEVQSMGLQGLIETFKKPAEMMEQLQFVYELLISLCVHVPVNDFYLRQTQLLLTNAQTYDPELHGAGHRKIALCMAVAYVINSLPYFEKQGFIFGLGDLVKPTSQRTRKFVSILMSFYESSLEVAPALQKAFADHDAKKEKRLELKDKIDRLKKEINQKKLAKAQRNERVNMLKDSLNTLNVKVEDAVKNANAIDVEGKHLDEQVAKEKETLNYSKERRMKLLEERERLKGQIVTSPEKKQRDFDEGKRRQAETEQELREVRSKAASMGERQRTLNEASQVLDSLLSVLEQCIELTVKEEEQLRGKRLKENQIEDLQQKLKIAKQELDKQTTFYQTRYSALKTQTQTHDVTKKEHQDAKKNIKKQYPDQKEDEAGDEQVVTVSKLEDECREIRQLKAEIADAIRTHTAQADTTYASILESVDRINEETAAQCFAPLMRKLCPEYVPELSSRSLPSRLREAPFGNMSSNDTVGVETRIDGDEGCDA